VIKVIIGLGNPGAKHYYQRHNIGFRVLDMLACSVGAAWQEKKQFEQASVTINDQNILLVKPHTYMNNSGLVIPMLTKQGIKPDEIVVVHDELELPFGSVKYKFEGSHKGHNGLRSIMGACGPAFGRIRCGIGRPDCRERVSEYVLEPFSEERKRVEGMIQDAIRIIEDLTQSSTM